MATIPENDTICAISTPLGEGGVGIIRVSGKQAIEMVERVFRGKKTLKDAPSHTIHLGLIQDPVTAHNLDEVLVSVFRAPHSYTGEETIEISCHGGLATTRSILKLIASNGARLAEPGEFTKRAFLNGRLDLAQAEAVLDVIRAKTDLSLQSALENLKGRLSHRVGKLKEKLLRLTAHVEAYIDFPQFDIEVFSQSEMKKEFTEIQQEVEAILNSFQTGSLLRQGVLVAIVGRPNVGKSSLFNALLDRDRAIVSDIAGTTRDTIEECIDLKGIPVRLVDTAGITETKDRVEKMGIDRTRQLMQEADFFLLVLDRSTDINQEDEKLIKELNTKKTFIVLNKSDLVQKTKSNGFHNAIEVSTKTQDGLEKLEKKLFEHIGSNLSEKGNGMITKERQRQALLKTQGSLQSLDAGMKEKRSCELLSLDLREALTGLQEIVGEIYTEDILDVIFAEFCIGK